MITEEEVLALVADRDDSAEVSVGDEGVQLILRLARRGSLVVHSVEKREKSENFRVTFSRTIGLEGANSYLQWAKEEEALYVKGAIDWFGENID